MADTYVSLRDEALMRRYPEIFGPGPWPVNDTMLGSGLVLDHSQNMTVAARATAERKTFGHLS